MKKYLSVVVTILSLSLFLACSKKAEQDVQQPPSHPLKQGPIVESPRVPQDHGTTQKREIDVVVPPEIKDRWSAVRLLVNDTKSQKIQEFTVKLGEELNIPDSKLRIKIGPFLPDFRLGAEVITSASSNLNNPAVGVVIFENNTKIFPESGKWGWLYAEFPQIHPFQHSRFKIFLKEGVEKS